MARLNVYDVANNLNTLNDMSKHSFKLTKAPYDNIYRLLVEEETKWKTLTYGSLREVQDFITTYICTLRIENNIKYKPGTGYYKDK